MGNFLKKIRESDGVRPQWLRGVAVGCMMLMILLTFAVANLQSMVWVASDWLVSAILPAVIVTETNEERQEENVSPLRRSAVLDYAATMKAEHMAAEEYFAHESPAGVTPWHWFDEAGYRFVHAGENLAIYFTDSSEIVEAWMASDSHRANILNGDYEEIGIGVAEGEYEGYETVYVVQLFGTQAAPLAQNDEPISVPVGASEVEGNAVATEPQVAGATEEVSAPRAAQTEGELVMHEDTVVLRSGHVATTTGGVPASASLSPGSDALMPHIAESTASFLAVAAQPGFFLQVLYIAVAGLALGALAFAIARDVRARDHLQVAYGFSLVILFFALFHVHVSITAGTL